MRPASSSEQVINPQVKRVSTETEALLSGSQSHVLGDHIVSGLMTFPLSQPLTATDPPRLLTFTNGLALVIGIQVGSGIFASPSAIVTDVGSPGRAMLVWLLAGFLAWTGAASFIELGNRVPVNGGVQEYLRYCYNDTYGFLAAWTLVLVVKPCSVAVISLTFSEYLNRAFTFQENPSIWIMRGTALLSAVLITYINCRSTRTSANAANIFLVMKLVGLGSIIVTGLVLGLMRFPHMEETPETSGGDDKDVNAGFWGHLGSYTDATLTALWAYSGWEALGLVGGELQNPLRNLSRVLNSAMAIVISLFVLANVAYFIALPLDVLKETNTIALDFGHAVFGTPGTLFYACIVCLSCLGALNSKIFTAGRLTEAAVQRQYLPSILTAFPNSPGIPPMFEDIDGSSSTLPLARQRQVPLEKSQSIPINAMLLNLCLASIYLLFGTLRSLLIFVGMADSVLLFAAVAGVLVLRLRPRSIDQGSPKAVTYIFNPVIYLAVSAVVVVRSAVEHPVHGIVIVLFYGVGVGLYRSHCFTGWSWWRVG